MTFVFDAVFIVVGLAFIYSGILGLRGKEIAVPVGRGGGITRVTGNAARFMGAVLLLLGLAAIGSVAKLF